MPYPHRPPRYPTHIPVIVTQGEKPQTCTIVDINAYGACVTGISPLEMDDPVQLRGAIESNKATVRWQGDGRAGVFFEQPMQPQQLAMLRLRGAVYPPSGGLDGARAV